MLAKTHGQYQKTFGYCHHMSSVCLLSSSVAQVYCNKTAEVTFTQFSPNVAQCLNVLLVSLTTKFEGDFLDEGLELGSDGFRLYAAIYRKR